MFLFYLSKVLIHFPCVVFNLLRTFLEFVLHRTNIICHTNLLFLNKYYYHIDAKTYEVSYIGKLE